MNGRSFLRVTGWLYESGEFRPGVGWETERIRVRPRADPGADTWVELRDEGGATLVSRRAEVRTDACTGAALAATSRRRIIGYVPLQERASAAVVRVGDRVVHETVLAPRPPAVADVAAELHGERLRVQWHAKHDRPLWFNAFVVDGRGRPVRAAVETREPEVVVDLAQVPGGPQCTVVVQATDGLRSSVARSATIDLPLTPPTVAILSPRADEELTPYQPISLLGNASDVAGEPLPEDDLVWFLDGERVSEGMKLVAHPPLVEGTHTIRLEWGGAATAIRVTVPQPMPAQREWRRIVDSE